MIEGVDQATQFVVLAEGQGMACNKRFEAVKVVQFREAPGPASESARRLPVEQYGATAVGQDRHQRTSLRQRLTRLGLRIIGSAVEQVRTAAGDRRVKQVTGLAAHTEGNTKVYYRLSVVIGPCMWGEASGDFPQRPGHLRLVGIAVLRQIARQYTLSVTVENRDTQTHRQIGDGSSGEAADARQFGGLLDVMGRLPDMPLDHDLHGLI